MDGWIQVELLIVFSISPAFSPEQSAAGTYVSSICHDGLPLTARPIECNFIHQKTVMRTLGILAALYATASVGATIELQAFDLKRCLNWHMTSDTGGAGSEAYRVALARTQSNYSVFSAVAVKEGGGNIERFGACSFEYKNNKAIFQCLANQDHPFAGSVFETNQSQPFPTSQKFRGRGA